MLLDPRPADVGRLSRNLGETSHPSVRLSASENSARKTRAFFPHFAIEGRLIECSRVKAAQERLFGSRSLPYRQADANDSLVLSLSCERLLSLEMIRGRGTSRTRSRVAIRRHQEPGIDVRATLSNELVPAINDDVRKLLGQ